MKNILIINGGQQFGHSGGQFNQTIAETTLDFFSKREGYAIQVTHVAQGYDADAEVQKFTWADIIIYHTPIWWFQVPFGFKQYLDEVFTAGHEKGIYHNDGRSTGNPDINYGTGGMLHGRQYMLTTSWNAPATAFTLPGEFFLEKSVDEGPMFGFHRMNAFTGMTPLTGFHFHDVEKNANVPRDTARYRKHLEATFALQEIPTQVRA